SAASDVYKRQPYAQLDMVLLGFEKGLTMERIALESGATLETVKTVARVMELTSHMRVPAT
ncbi:MAG: hypothetical protein N2255_06235, partial [Kiritimatiellae bacterium]|nr:hypothetical protein [Kiritimatiellia bacterium]